MDDQEEIVIEQLGPTVFRVTLKDFIMTVTFNSPEAIDPDNAMLLLSEFFDKYDLLTKERRSKAKLILAFGIVFDELRDQSGLTEEKLFDGNEGV